MKKRSNFKIKFFLELIVLFIGLVISPGITHAFADSEESNSIDDVTTIVQKFSSPTISEDENYAIINVEEADSQLTNPGEPKLPIFTKTLEFPWGTEIKNIECIHSEIKTKNLSKKIQPAPTPKSTKNVEITINEEPKLNIYNSDELYPSNWFSAEKGAGVNKDGKPVLFVFIRLCPVRYIPAADSIEYVDSIELSISHDGAEIVEAKASTYDLVIISPSEYVDNLQILVEHKNSFGVKTNLITLNHIYDAYPGRDKAEKIKYFVKYAYDEWNIRYVLLVGDIKKLPIRTVYSCWFEEDALSDLYYGDIYDAEYEFCSWDGNENNKFAELYYGPGRDWPPDILDVDDVDLCAEVHVGRLACVDEDEVDVVVDKIITYEQETYGSVWFNKIILAGGDTFPPGGGSQFSHFEGEVTNTQVAQQVPDLDKVKLWCSKRNLNALTFNREINKGAGFLTYAGHGFEHGWGTYRPNQLISKMSIFSNPMYYTPFVKYLKNQYRLPVIFFDACLTAKLDFNITDLADYTPIAIKLLCNQVTNSFYRSQG